MNYILFDDNKRDKLLPLTYMRPVADIRFGILTIREKWEHYLEANTSSLTQDYLSEKYPIKKMSDNILINGSVCPNPTLVEEIKLLKPNQAIVIDDQVIAMYIKGKDLESSEQSIEEERRLCMITSSRSSKKSISIADSIPPKKAKYSNACSISR